MSIAVFLELFLEILVIFRNFVTNFSNFLTKIEPGKEYRSFFGEYNAYN